MCTHGVYFLGGWRGLREMRHDAGYAGQYQSTPHRVINPDPSRSRVSIPFFYEPAFDAKARTPASILHPVGWLLCVPVAAKSCIGAVHPHLTHHQLQGKQQWQVRIRLSLCRCCAAS